LIQKNSFYNDAQKQIKILRNKIKKDYSLIYFLHQIKSIFDIKNIFSVESSIDGKYKKIKIFCVNFIKERRK
jgi:hypothetical protein